jgi:hypothetical protein
MHLERGQLPSSEGNFDQNIPSRSLKLLPMLGVPSLSRPVFLPLPTGLRPASSAVRRGDRGPGGICRRFEAFWVGFVIGAVELADESEVRDS